MTANDRPWDIRLWLYPGGNPSGRVSDWGLEQDITAYVKYPGSLGGQQINYNGGRRGEATSVDFGEMSLSLDNKDGRFCTDNVSGAYWPLLDLNTPIRMGVVSGFDTFTRTGSGLGTSTSGQTWVGGATTYATTGTNATCSVPVANAATRSLLDGAGSTDFDMTFTTWVPNVATGAVLFSACMNFVDTDNYVLLGVDFGLAGAMGAKIHATAGGVFTNLATTDPLGLTYTAGEKFRVRCMRDGATLAVKIWKQATAEPAAWSAVASDTTVAGGSLGLYTWRLAGNTNTSPQVAYDDLTIIGIEHTGTVVQWPVEWDTTGRNSWASIRSAGILRRLRQRGTGAFSSTLRHQLPFFGPKDYWPLEDGERATTFANVIAGGDPAKFSNVQPAGSNSLPGAAASPVVGSGGGSIIGYASQTQGGNGFGILFAAKVGTNPAVSTMIARVGTSRGLVRELRLSLRGGVTPLIAFEGLAADGTSVFTDSTNPGPDVVDDWAKEWVAFCILMEQIGPNVKYTMLWSSIGATVAYFQDGTFASTIIPVARGLELGGPSWDGTAFAHMWIGPNTVPFVSGSFFNSFSGFDGETASARITRVAAQAGIPAAVVPGGSEILGPQPRGRAIDIIEQAANADYGLLLERGNGIAFVPRSARFNPAVSLALSVASKHLAAPPTPVRDDQRIRNRIIVSRDGGSSATAQDEASIERVGEYEDPVTLGVRTDAVLLSHAQWRRFIGTRTRMRWPSVPLNFARTPSLLPAWRVRPATMRATVVTGRVQVTGNEPDLLVEGFTASLDALNWTVDLSCSPAEVWDIGIYDDPTPGRSKYGPTGATLAAGINTTALQLAVNAAGERWVSGAVALAIAIGGEHIVAGNISPAGSIVVVDGGFESGVADWTAVGGSATQSSAQAKTGTSSCLITVSGSPTSVTLRLTSTGNYATVTAGGSYTLTFWIYSSITLSNLSGVISWYNGVSFLSSSGVPTTSAPANTWTKVTFTATAPATATRASYGPTVNGSPANGTLLYFDDVDLADVASDVMQFRQLTRSVNGVVKSHLSGAAVTLANQVRYGF